MVSFQFFIGDGLNLMAAHQSLNLRLIWRVLTTRRKPYIVVVKLNVWLHPYFRADPICFKSEPLTGLDPDLGLIVSRLWVGLGHQMAPWLHMYNAGLQQLLSLNGMSPLSMEPWWQNIDFSRQLTFTDFYNFASIFPFLNCSWSMYVIYLQRKMDKTFEKI